MCQLVVVGAFVSSQCGNVVIRQEIADKDKARDGIVRRKRIVTVSRGMESTSTSRLQVGGNFRELREDKV